MLPPLEPAQAREAAALPALPQRRVTEAFLHAISGLLDRSDEPAAPVDDSERAAVPV